MAGSESPSFKQPKTDRGLPLEVDPTIYINDPNVISTVRAYLEDNKNDIPLSLESKAFLLSLISTLVNTPRGFPGLMSSKCRAFLNDSKISKVVEDALNESDISGMPSILKLGFLYTNRNPEKERQPRSYVDGASVHRQDIVQVLKEAWDYSYVGDADKLFIQSLDDSPRTKPYCNTVSVIQSSGTGKSRMLSEASKQVFAIPFSFGPAATSSAIRYPIAQDTKVKDYLVGINVTETGVSTIEIHYHYFLGALFTVVREEIGAILRSEDQQSYPALCFRWHQEMCQDDRKRRSELYDKAIELAKQMNKTSSGDAGHQYMNDRLSLLLDDLNRLRNRRLEGKVQLLIYFDESDCLSQVIVHPTIEAGTSVFYRQALLRAINRWANRDVITVFLSTTLNMHDSKLAPIAHTVSSNRYRTISDVLPAPIIETPSDCSSSFPLKAGDAGKLTLSDVTTLEFIAQFGRPLWWSMFEGSRKIGKNWGPLVDMGPNWSRWTQLQQCLMYSSS